MANLNDIIRRALGGRRPEDALSEFKEKMHHAINHFKEDPKSQSEVRLYLRKVMTPLKYFNSFVVRPHMSDQDKLKALAQKYEMNKVELKRFFKLSLELEERLLRYFGDDIAFEQLVITLRKVINALDEQTLTDLIEAIDYNVDFAKIEKAYLTYQETLVKSYNTEGLRQDLKGILGSFVSSFKKAMTHSRPVYKASDKEPSTRTLPPALQKSYDHYRAEDYTHDEAMKFVKEKEDLEDLSQPLWAAYRVFREEGRDHDAAMAELNALAPDSDPLNSEEPLTETPSEDT